MVIFDFISRFYRALILLGNITCILAAVALCAEFSKLIKDFPNFIAYPLLIICFLSVVAPAAEGYGKFFPSEEAVQEQEAESESIEESINAAIESAYDQGYEDALEDQ